MPGKTFLFLLIFCVVIAAQALADVKLPDPKKDGGDGIFALLEKRASAGRGAFPKGEISPEELSTILWAATGLNRGGDGWTTPYAGGKPPYVKIYVATPSGAFLYDWKAQALTEVTDKNVLGEISGDSFVKDASCVLVFVSDTSGLGAMPSPDFGTTLAFIATGAMTQNIYLAADALGISGRYMISLNADGAKRELKLGDGDSPLCIMPLGKR